VRGRVPSLGVPPSGAATPAAADFAPLAALLAAGATLAGAARLDPLALSGAFQTLATRRAGSGGARGRAALGSAGAAGALVGGGAVDSVLGVDAGSEVLLAAACAGVVGFRASEGAFDLQACALGSRSTAAASFLLRDAAQLSKV